MKWTTYYPPKDGTIRERVVFLLFPERCTDGQTRWLEKDIVQDVWMSGGDDFGAGWCNRKCLPLTWIVTT